MILPCDTPDNFMDFLAKPPTKKTWVRETRFGRWFLRTNTWYRYVLTEAVVDFKNMLGSRQYNTKRVLDAGCGEGLAFSLLEKYFQPQSIDGVDIDGEQLLSAQKTAAARSCNIALEHCSAAQLPYSDNSFDIIFCHQLLHHTAEQEAVLQEFYRVLAPNGWLLVGESCRSFINTWPVRLLFRHPNHVQKDSAGYINLVRQAGFVVNDADIKTSTPWWSLPDLGLKKKWGLERKNKVPEATEVLILASKDISGKKYSN